MADPRQPFLVLPDQTIVNPFVYPHVERCSILIPGSFNPLHEGHKHIYQRWSGWDHSHAVFEISINRRDKEPLGSRELQCRLDQFIGYAPVLVTNCSQMMAKVGLFRFRPMVCIGIDTAERMIEDHTALGVQGINASFMVHDRIINNVRHSLDQLPHIPTNMQRIYVQSEYASESSTALRNK